MQVRPAGLISYATLINAFVEAFLMNVMVLKLAICLVLLGQQFFNDQVNKVLSLECIDWLRFGWSAGLAFFIVEQTP